MGNDTMEKLAKAAYNEYHKQWREKHKDKVKSYNAKYWARRAICATKATSEDSKVDGEN